jgi:periplasmic protein TonB
MFQSVIETQGMRSGRFGTGAVISFAVHAGLLLGVLWLTAAPKVPEFVEVIPGPFKRHVSAPVPAYGRPAPATGTVRPKPKKDRIPRSVPTTRPPEATPVEPAPTQTATVAQPGDDGVPGGHPLGDPNSVITGVPFVGQGVGGPPTGEDVLRFGAGMTPPRLLSGPALGYTREALEARVEGTVVVRCVITRQGETEDCRVLKGLPHLSESVRSALDARRYTPVTFQGRPVSVDYVFNVQLKLPQ